MGCASCGLMVTAGKGALTAGGLVVVGLGELVDAGPTGWAGVGCWVGGVAGVDGGNVSGVDEAGADPFVGGGGIGAGPGCDGADGPEGLGADGVPPPPGAEGAGTDGGAGCGSGCVGVGGLGATGGGGGNNGELPQEAGRVFWLSLCPGCQQLGAVDSGAEVSA